MMSLLGELLLHGCGRKCSNQHTFQFPGPASSTFARTITTDSRINISIGATAAQNWDESVFVLSPECPYDWGDFAAVGAAAATHPVKRHCWVENINFQSFPINSIMRFAILINRVAEIAQFLVFQRLNNLAKLYPNK